MRIESQHVYRIRFIICSWHHYIQRKRERKAQKLSSIRYMQLLFFISSVVTTCYMELYFSSCERQSYWFKVKTTFFSLLSATINKNSNILWASTRISSHTHPQIFFPTFSLSFISFFSVTGRIFFSPHRSCYFLQLKKKKKLLEIENNSRCKYDRFSQDK